MKQKRDESTEWIQAKATHMPKRKKVTYIWHKEIKLRRASKKEELRNVSCMNKCDTWKARKGKRPVTKGANESEKLAYDHKQKPGDNSVVIDSIVKGATIVASWTGRSTKRHVSTCALHKCLFGSQDKEVITIFARWDVCVANVTKRDGRRWTMYLSKYAVE